MYKADIIIRIISNEGRMKTSTRRGKINLRDFELKRKRAFKVKYKGSRFW